MEDLATWSVKLEEPLSTTYRGVTVYKLREWQQGPVMLQALNILEGIDIKSMGYNSAKYMHTLYQSMNLAYADRDFYYGDPAFPPEEPIRGLLSKDYARTRAATINPTRNDPAVKPGDPYPFQGGTNPFLDLLKAWPPKPLPRVTSDASARSWEAAFYAGTTSIQAADSSGWVVSITPSGGWIPAVIAGRTGVGLSQRAQQFVTDRRENPFNVIEPGKRPRVTLTPTLAFKDNLPWMAFSVQGGDSQDQNLLQYFLNVVEFGMTPQQAAEAPNLNSFQMKNSFDDHSSQPGRMLVASSTPAAVQSMLRRMGYTLQFAERTSGPITAIWFDRAHGTMWGAASNFGEDYGIAW
jgi:gamma-glutamyltranspeptidase/glutathione hydrolase